MEWPISKLCKQGSAAAVSACARCSEAILSRTLGRSRPQMAPASLSWDTLLYATYLNVFGWFGSRSCAPMHTYYKGPCLEGQTTLADHSRA